MLFAHHFEVLDAFLHRLHVAEHHRDAAGQAEPMRGVHHAHPLRGVRLQRCDAVAHAVHEDFPAATGHGAKPSGDEVFQDLLDGFVEELGEGDHLAGAKTVDVEAGELVANVREQIKIPLLRELGVVAALHEDLVTAQRDGLLNLPVHLVMRDDVGVGILLSAVERAELTIDVADVRVVDVAVHDVGDDLVAAPTVRCGAVELAAAVGQRAQFLQRQGVEAEGLGGVNAPAVPDFLEQLVE